MTGSQTSTDELGEYQQLLDQKKPGAAIKFLRETKGVSLERITRETLIPDWKLSDLENDVYGGLGGPIFVMGYLRKIAKILNLDSDPLIEAYGHQPSSTQESQTILAGEPRIKRRRNRVLSNINRIPGLAIIAGLLLVWVGAVAYMKSVGTGENDQPPLSSREVEEVPVAQPASDILEKEVHNAAAQVGLSDNHAAISPSLEEPVVPAAPIATPVPVPVSVPVEAEPVVDLHAATQISGTVAAPEPRPAGVAGEDLLTLAFIQDCWVQVTDASGKVLFAQLQRTGDNQHLFGQAPFRVMLGNAQAVEIMLNGEAFAFSPIPGRDTLRLTVGP